MNKKFEVDILNASNFTSFGFCMSSRKSSTPRYRYAFNGMEKNEEWNEGSYDFGARMYDGRSGRWLAIDPLTSKYPNESPYCFVGNSPIIMIDPDGKEKIIVVGSQHDNSAGNKMMFVHQAIRKIKEYKTQLKAANSNEIVTMIIMKEGYTEKQLNRMQQHATKNGYNLVMANSSEEVTNYVGSTYTEVGNQDFIGSALRSADPVTSLDFFAHGLPLSIELGYETKMADAYRFDATDLANLSSSSFAKDAIISSYACRTAMGNEFLYLPKYDPILFPTLDDFYKSVASSGESLAQKMANKTNRNVMAYFARTDYSGTLGTTTDRVLRKLGLDDGWLDKQNSNQEKIDGAAFDPDGAGR